MGDFNIDIIKEDCLGFDKLEEICDRFNFTNLIKSETCYTNNHKLTIDLFFTNRPVSFQGTSTAETGLSNCYKFIYLFSIYLSFTNLISIYNQNSLPQTARPVSYPWRSKQNCRMLVSLTPDI